MNWREYEIYIARHLKRAFPSAHIEHDVRVPGIISKTNRQIDILIRQVVAGFEVRIVVDCKFFSSKIDVKEVDSFVGFLSDVRASKGILITNAGYTDAACNRATFDTRDIELRILNFKDLEKISIVRGDSVLRKARSRCVRARRLGDRRAAQSSRLLVLSISGGPVSRGSISNRGLYLRRIQREG